MVFGAGRALAAAPGVGVVMMLTLGRGIGIALFDNGVLVRNAEFSDILSSWSSEHWVDASCPPPSTAPGSPAFARWARRVSSFLQRVLTAGFSPDVMIVGGSAALSLDSWAPLLTGIGSTPVVRAELTNSASGDGEEQVMYDLGGSAGTVGKVSGMLGSAVGASLQLTLRDDLARVRAALGKQAGASPQKLGTGELRSIFTSFGAAPRPGSDELALDYSQMKKAIAALGVKLSTQEHAEMVYEVDAGREGAPSHFAERRPSL
jgi:hypothetical protein